MTVTTPWGVRTRVHKAIKDRFLLACQVAVDRSDWTPRRIDGFVNRPIRGMKTPSMHSWGLAWDFFETPPGVVPKGGVWDPVPEESMDLHFASAFLGLGFTWGATWSRKDEPHFEWGGSIEAARIDWKALERMFSGAGK